MISKEINDRAVETDTVIEFPYLLMYICIDTGVPKIQDLGLARDIANPISKATKKGEKIIRQAFKARKHGINTIGFTNMGETLIEISQPSPWASTNSTNTFQTLTPPFTVVP